MKAAFAPSSGILEIREVARPVPGPGEVLVRVQACGICGSDLHWYRGESTSPAVCPGHEIAGEVEEVGPAVDGLEIGQRVVVEPLVPCRECEECRTGNYQLCQRLEVLGMMRHGGFAEFVVAPAYALFTLPADLSFELGALAEPMAVSVHALRLGSMRLGDRVLVLGAGTIGLLGILAARAAGAGEIAVTARYPHQATLARALGAEHVFATDAEGDRERNAYSKAMPIDLVIETVGGVAPTLDVAVRAVRPGGCVVVLGIFSKATEFNVLRLVTGEVRLIGSMVYGRYGARADFDSALGVLRRSRSDAERLITHRRALGDIQDAFALAADKHSGAVKVMISGHE